MCPGLAPADMIVRGHRPRLAVLAGMDTICFHCAKAFLRSAPWQPDTWHPEAVPGRAAIVKSVQDTPGALADLERY